MTTGRINQISIGAVTRQCAIYVLQCMHSTLIGVGFDRVLRLILEKISRVHRVMFLVISKCNKAFDKLKEHTVRDVLTSCFRAESPRSATGIALSGFCSTKFLLLFFGLCFSQRTSRGKSARARRKIEMI